VDPRGARHGIDCKLLSLMSHDFSGGAGPLLRLFGDHQEMENGTSRPIDGVDVDLASSGTGPLRIEVKGPNHVLPQLV
jgi:hypothetical protein